MKRTLLPSFLLAAAMLAVPAVDAADPDPSVVLAVPQGDSIAIRIPPGWKRMEGKPQPDAPTAINLSSPLGLQMNVTMIADPEGKFSKPEAVDELVSMAGQQYVANSIEKTPQLVHLKAKVGYGAYCIFTDARLAGVATPGEGEYRNVTSGVFVLGKQAAIFFILSNDTKSEDFQRALDLIASGISVVGAGS